MPRLQLRDYQQRIVADTMAAVRDGHRSILIESPTGSGKTLIAHVIAKALYRRYGYRTGWTAMRRHLLHQAAEDNRRWLGFDPITYFSPFTDDPPTGFEVLIEDEGHHAASDTSAAVFNKVQPTIHIATTATPYRADQAKLCFSKTIRNASIAELIDGGYLTPYRHHAFEGRWTPETVTNLYRKDPDRWGPSVMFFHALEPCYRAKALLEQAGVRCDVVSGATDQESQIAAFERGDLDVLINVQVLTEGFNSPRLRTVFARPSVQGMTVQMVGRALRLHPGKPYANVVQAVDSPWPFTRTAPPQAKHVLEDGQWVQRADHAQRVVRAQASTLRAVASLDVRLPQQLRHCRIRRQRL